MRTLVLFVVLTLAATLSASGHFPYIYKEGDSVTHIRNNRGSIEQIVATSKRWRGDYVWLERDGKEYLIRDASVLAEVRAVFADMHALEPKLRAAEERARPLEEKMDQLSDHIGDDDPPNREELEKELDEITAQYDAAEKVAERLEREQERLERIAEAKFEKIVFRAIDEGKAQRVD
ncbi:MAG TPA: hypothetical protein VM733_06340 [Thermoanaerobaculia bacterium]|nr:hypothetical protein [Thermoanaerobaculia bacterium]